MTRTPTRGPSSPGSADALRPLAGAVGDFIAYWGFRGIHGQLWTVIWLSQDALTGAALVRALGVSKALVSPALTELEEYGLIKQVKSDDARAKRYVANPDVYEVIKDVLRKREMSLLARAEGEATYVARRITTDASLGEAIDAARLAALQSMIAAGNTALMLLTSSDALESVFLGQKASEP